MSWNAPVAWKAYLSQTSALTAANLKSRYRNTFAGFIWVMINPLIIYSVQGQVFSKILKIQLSHYYLFLLSGLLPWLFITQTIEMCTPLFQYSGHLLKAFPAHPMVYLSAQLIDNLINFIAAFLIILIPVTLLEHAPMQGLILLPIPLLALGLAVLGFSWLLSTVQVFLRDTRYVMSFVLTTSFYLTPIFYSVDLIPLNYRWIVPYNPFYALIAPFRYCLYQLDWDNFIFATGKAFLLAFVMIGLAWWHWQYRRNEFYLNV